MSTIEKAAARLAARSKVANRAEEDAPPSAVAAERVPAESVIADYERSLDAEFRPIEQSPSEPPRAEPAVAPRRAATAPDHRVELELDRLRERGYLTPGITRTPLAQQMRRLKRPLLLRMQKARATLEDGPPANLIMITSSLPGEGKTFTSINLAMSMAAELDHRVLLVDADPSRGDISRQFGLPLREGLAGLLARGSDYVEGEIFDTNVERLSILPAGQPIEHVDELYASSTMANLVHSVAMADPDRIIIFDCAPLLAATEVAVLARLVGQIIVVVEANRTPQDAVLRALHMLEGCSNVSLVLNKSTAADEGSYGYGYGYGAFGGEGAAPSGGMSGG